MYLIQCLVLCVVAMSYSPTDKPTVHQLCSELSSITDDWQCFAILLPGIEMKHIEAIEDDHHGVHRRKMAVFKKWLDVHPGATWSNVYDALVSVDKVLLARSLVKVVNQSVSDIASSPMSLPHTPPSQQPPLPATQQSLVTPQPPRIHITDDSEVEQSLDNLFTSFKDIVFDVREELSTFVSEEPGRLQRVIRYLETISPLTTAKLDSSSFQEFFHALRPYYDFLECGVLRDIVKKFIGGKLLEALQTHASNARTFRRTAPIKHLATEIHRVFTSFQDLPMLEAKLESPWEEVAIEGLYVLIQHLLPKTAHSQDSLMNNIVISPGCLLLQYGIRDHSMIDTIIQHVQHNIELMRLIGVFQLAVDGTPVIHEDEDPSFSFNTSLLDATAASNNVAVQCLLDIGANVNYQDDDGNTALMWAMLINNIDIMHQLLQAGADVHIQDKYGATALMVACAGSEWWDLPPDVHRLSDDDRDTVRLLLSHGADPLAVVNIGDGVSVSSFDMACAWDNIDVVEMLLTDYNIPPEAVVRGLYYALLGAATNTIKLLQSKIPDVDPLAIKLGVSCGERDIETVKSLIEQGVDPNTVIVHGLTPLMIASDNGHTNIADTLIHSGAKVNMVDDIRHWTALDYAKYNHDMTSLLKQHGGMHKRDISSLDEDPRHTFVDEPEDTVPSDTPTTNNTPGSSRYGGPFLFIFKRFHKFRKLIPFLRPKQQQLQGSRSNIVQDSIPQT